MSLESRSGGVRPPPPLVLPLNRDAEHAIDQAIKVLQTIVTNHPEVGRDFDSESFIHHELAPALAAIRSAAGNVAPISRDDIIEQCARACDAAADTATGDAYSAAADYCARLVRQLKGRVEMSPQCSTFRLDRTVIEAWRKQLVGYFPATAATEIHALCDMALKSVASEKLTHKDAALLPGLREALAWKPNTPQLENAMTYAWESALKSFIRAIENT